uniref:uncharacterized protein LOC118546020 isoform X3 n=1 Tax=Halichoerus grypus TaxID=9711 RepID=UPI001659827D|nr:uncharacterized protein LOC118546020 isoform X3 [Halichoerus grypus]
MLSSYRSQLCYPGLAGSRCLPTVLQDLAPGGRSPHPPPPTSHLPPRNSTLTCNESSSNVPSVVLDPLLLQKLQMKLVQKVWDRMLTGYDVRLSPNFEDKTQNLAISLILMRT